MIPSRRFYALSCSLILVLAAACKPAAASVNPVVQSTPTASMAAVASQAANCPESTDHIEICTSSALSGTSVGAQSPVPQVVMPTVTLSLASPTPGLANPAPGPTPCPPDLCSYASQYFLQRPIASPGNDQVDITYRFGSTQSGRRDPHHGVEFLNAFGTPVQAAADGVVVVAGDDKQPTSPHGAWPITFYGPYSNFYGNLVVIEHHAPAEMVQAFPEMPLPLYTLYAHLSEIAVIPGETVKAGQEIGKVGMTGIAEGSHLHFEVRLGENTYNASRNPELWLAPHLDANGQPLGGIAGSFIDSFGDNLPLDSIVLEHLPGGSEKPNDLEITLLSYEEKKLIGQPPWEESFAIGDLPPGWYRISFPHGGLQERLVQVLPGQLTAVTFRLE